jgi:hypothetical protein
MISEESEFNLLEVLYDLSWSLAYDFAIGRIKDEFSDSRERFDLLLSWAREFESVHAKPDWGDTDAGYVDAVNDFYHSKVDAALESGGMLGGPIREVILVVHDGLTEVVQLPVGVRVSIFHL